MSTETKKIETLKAHLAINVRNVVESTVFYRKMFGIEPSKIRTGYAKFDVENPPLNFTLNEVPSGGFSSAGALSHLGIQVASTADVLAVRERWAEQGLITRDEMDTNCCYAIQDKTWVHDPDNNEWEVFVVKEDDLAESTACCATDEKGNEVCATTGKIVLEAAGAEAESVNRYETKPAAHTAPCCG
jgi:catechol 2,3-dioxygenase-like lactoylglutathione lyase family enzyme